VRLDEQQRQQAAELQRREELEKQETAAKVEGFINGATC